MNEHLPQILPIHFAPLQGYTDAIYRNAHALFFGGVDGYYAPFARVEHGEVRHKELRDVNPMNNIGTKLIPQLLASNAEKATMIAERFVEMGYHEIDVNLGCPFPMLAKRHNGSGLLPYPEEVETMLTDLIRRFPQTGFSVKLRLGWDDAEESLRLLPLFNRLPLTHLTLHPRLGKQQYKGEVDLNAFETFYEGCEKPLFYNGDLLTIEDIHRVEERFPQLAGIVIGRGLLTNPALALEYKQGKTLPEDELRRRIANLHDEVYEAYCEQLHGDETQLLRKMKTFWEYLLPNGNHKAKKTIHKTSKLANYQAAVSSLIFR